MSKVDQQIIDNLIESAKDLEELSVALSDPRLSMAANQFRKVSEFLDKLKQLDKKIDKTIELQKERDESVSKGYVGDDPKNLS